MNTELLQTHTSEPLAPRKRWEKPAIVLERSLEVSAQDGPPGAPGGFLGPLGTPGGSGTCV